MANGDDAPYSGSYFDQSFGALPDPNPVGMMNADQLSSGDPLADWGSNLKQDDLAKLLQDPYRQAQELAARGIPPPPADAMHDANDAAGTPSRSTRFGVQPATPLDPAAGAQPLSGPYRVDPSTGRLMNLTSSDQGGRIGVPGAVSPFPGGTTTEGATSQPPAQPPGQVFVPGQGLVTRPGVPTPGGGITTVTPPPASAAPPATPAPGPAAAAAPPPYTPPYQPPPARKAQPGEGVMVPPGAAMDISTDTAKAEKDKAEKQKKVEDAISDLGKAMQGVKAPPPLQPPNIGAPSVRSTQNAGMSPIASLLGALSRTQTGQVPPSLMPVLKMLGRA